MYPPIVHISDIKATEDSDIYNIYFTNGSNSNIVEKVQYNITSRNQNEFNDDLLELPINNPIFKNGNNIYNVILFANDSNYIWIIKNETNYFTKQLNISLEEIPLYWSFISEKYNSAYLIIPPYFYITKLDHNKEIKSGMIQSWDAGGERNLYINEDLDLFYSSAGCCYCVSRLFFSYSEENIEFLVQENVWDIIIIDSNTKQLIYANEFDYKITHYQLNENKVVSIELKLKILNGRAGLNFSQIFSFGIISFGGLGLGIFSAIIFERLMKK
ncbi:MAG: hypothetical protein HeimC3_17290 [Candidatus Heimdallarchaeota archaeon LC_3]|nr:MAG: hypothetical protein HeimC3_17290 [Candidatus Heimdallarchaeota archaeon LC_3]